MASLTATPTNPRVGEAISIQGDGFAPSTEVVVSIEPLGIISEIIADGSGAFGTEDLADKAVAVLTLSGNAVAAETVTIGSKTYTWRASVGTTANEVLIGGTAAASLLNLKAAVNLEGGAVYGSNTTINADATALTPTATQLRFAAKVAGTSGNSIASTEVMTNGSFGGTTFSGGAAATGAKSVELHVGRPMKLTVVASDGTNSATLDVYVWSNAS